ncbi:MAG TPA: hypothetical protein VLC09_12925 [Polyangiaceae bacterium]|nr:hypothetical protein [Polyangiaceae bacterium]
MLWAFLVIFGSVLAGALLAFVPTRRGNWLGPVRTFALTAALGVVLVHLMPEAFEGIGPMAALALAAGFWLPGWIGRLGALAFRAREPARRQQDLALEASYFGLLLHHVGDGIGLGAYTGELSSAAGSGGVVTALAAHVVPVVAIVVLTFDAVHGRGHALGRALGLAVASVLGVLLAHSLPGGVFATAGPWVAALVGGTLLHVVSHDLYSDPPEGSVGRSLDLLSGALGFLISWLGAEIHSEPGSSGLADQFGVRFFEFSIELAPVVLACWFVVARLSMRRAGYQRFDTSVFFDVLGRISRRTGPWIVASVFLLAWVDVLTLDGHPQRPFVVPHRHEPWLLCVAALAGLTLLSSVWTIGLRAWLGRLMSPLGGHGHAHGHSDGHAHGDDHSHGHAHGDGHDHLQHHGDPHGHD